MALEARFQKLSVGWGGAYYQGGAEFSERQGRATFSERARFSNAIMYFFIRVISMSTLLFIHITLYIIISLI